jgi:hypothetical protein
MMAAPQMGNPPPYAGMGQPGVHMVVPSYGNQAAGNPFDNYDRKGPSADSWHKDGVDMGMVAPKKTY